MGTVADYGEWIDREVIIHAVKSFVAREVRMKPTAFIRIVSLALET